MINPLRKYAIEIMALIGSFGGSLYGAVTMPEARLKIMREYQSEFLNYGNPRMVDDAIQQKLVLWNDYRTAIWTPVVMITVAFLGAWSDLRGRQINMLLGSAVMILGLMENNFLWSNYFNLPLWTTIVFAFVSALFGSFEVSMTAMNAYLTDTIPDKDQLTVRLTVLIVVSSVGGFAGNMVAFAVSRRFYVLNYLLLPTVLFVFNFYFLLIFVPQIPPNKLVAARLRREGRADEADAIERNMKSREKESTLNPLSLLKQRFVLSWQALMSLFRKRPGGKRAMLMVVVLIAFIDGIALMEAGRLFSMFMVRSQFHFQSDGFGLYGAYRIVASTVGMVVGVLIMKKWLKMRDTAIILVSMVCRIASTSVMIFASQPWHLYLIPTISAIGSAAGPVTYAFITRLVDPDEVGKLFTMFILMFNISNLIDQYILQTVYALTVGWFASFVWVLVVAMLVVTFLLMIWVHRYAVRNEIEEGAAAKRRRSTQMAVN